MLRRITFVVLLAASAAVLLLSLYLLWNAHPWDYLPFVDRPASNLDARAQLLNDKIDIYNHELEDLGKLVALLLVLSGLYTIAFAISSHYAAERYKDICSHAVDLVHEEFESLVGDLRAVQEQAERAVERAAIDSGRVEELLRQNSAIAAQPPAALDFPAAVQRLHGKLEKALGSGLPAAFEVSECEHVLATLSVLADSGQAPLLAPVYRDLAVYHERREFGRARYYRDRANALVPGIAPEPDPRPSPTARPVDPDIPRSRTPDPVDPLITARLKYNDALLSRSSGHLDDAGDLLCVALNFARKDPALAAEIRYELACTLALQGPAHFEEAMKCLSEAFRSRTPAIEKRISRDIDNGGALQALAAQPPFDKAVNDLLLDVNVG